MNSRGRTGARAADVRGARSDGDEAAGGARMKPYYEHGGVTIYHGDCREVLPLLSEHFDAALADPPYGQTSLSWDHWPAYWVREVAARTRSLWCFGSLRMFLAHRAEFADWKLSQDVIWEKHNGSAFHADRFKRVHEQIAHFYRGEWRDVYHETPTTPDATARAVRRKRRPPHLGAIDASTYRSEDGGPRLCRSVLYARSLHGTAQNETAKPPDLLDPLVIYAVPPAGRLLVPFSGSGNELLAAYRSGRSAVGVELREEQCEIAAKRLAQELLPLEGA